LQASSSDLARASSFCDFSAYTGPETDACQPPKIGQPATVGRRGDPSRHEAPKGLSWSPKGGQQVMGTTLMEGRLGSLNSQSEAGNNLRQVNAGRY
jgi:hypothetical protein